MSLARNHDRRAPRSASPPPAPKRLSQRELHALLERLDRREQMLILQIAEERNRIDNEGLSQLEADANYFWEPMSPDLIIGAGRPSRSNACRSRACRLPTVTR